MIGVEVTCLDLVHVADSVIELDGSPFLHVGLLLSCRSIQSLRCRRCRCMGIPRHGRMSCNGAAWASWLAALLNGAVVIERSALAGPLWDSAVADLSRCAELSLRTLYAVLDRSLPARRPLLLHKSLCRSRRGCRSSFDLYSCARTN